MTQNSKTASACIHKRISNSALRLRGRGWARAPRSQALLADVPRGIRCDRGRRCAVIRIVKERFIVAEFTRIQIVFNRLKSGEFRYSPPGRFPRVFAKNAKISDFQRGCRLAVVELVSVSNGSRQTATTFAAAQDRAPVRKASPRRKRLHVSARFSLLSGDAAKSDLDRLPPFYAARLGPWPA